MVTVITKFDSLHYVLIQQLSERSMETVNQTIQKWRDQYRGVGQMQTYHMLYCMVDAGQIEVHNNSDSNITI
jgi:hypothetical protein